MRIPAAMVIMSGPMAIGLCLGIMRIEPLSVVAFLVAVPVVCSMTAYLFGCQDGL